MTMTAAARVGDDIAHSNAGTGMLLGILAGAAVGVALVAATVATGGLALVAAAGAAAGMVSAGGLGGMYIGEASMGPPCGKFIVGSTNVFINGRGAIFTFGSMALCSKDGSSPIPLATGSSTVIINIGMAGRQDEKIGCSAKSVPQVSPNVFIGGAGAQDPRVTITPEVPAWAVTTLQVLGIAGAIAALPFAIVTVGVAATVGGVVLGFAGALGGAAGGRALGEALGMSEAGIRSLEVAGGFLGGMVGGAAGTKGGLALGNRVLPPAKTPLGVTLRQGRTGGNPAAVAAVNRMPDDFQAEYAAARAAGWKKPDGTTWWPPNNGGVGAPKNTRLPSGMKLDRYGDEGGGFMSAAGDSFEQRALPGQPSGPANKYTTGPGLDGKGLAVEESPIAPWFDQPGGGTQYRLADPSGLGSRYNVGNAIRDQYLTRGH